MSATFGFRLATRALDFVLFLAGGGTSVTASDKGVGSFRGGSGCGSMGAFLRGLGTRTRFRTFRLTGFCSIGGS